MRKVLLYGFGNIGRQDDGLGILFVERMEEMAKNPAFGHLDFEANYQLNIEDAHTISQYDEVYFADAAVNQPVDVEIKRVEASDKTEFTMHAMDPSFILHLCQALYNRSPETYIITMKAFDFEFGIPISAGAAQNLEAAVDRFTQFLSTKNDEIATPEQSNHHITLNL